MEQLVLSAQTEDWSLIPGWVSYEASTHGRIRQVLHMRYQNSSDDGILAFAYPSRDPDRPRVTLSEGNHAKSFGVQYLVCLTFHGPRPSPRHTVAHWNGNALDNRPANLRWATFEENEADKVRHGRAVRGTAHPLAKLTEADVRAIRQRAAGGESHPTLAAAYGVSRGKVWQIVHRRSWTHVV